MTRKNKYLIRHHPSLKLRSRDLLRRRRPNIASSSMLIHRTQTWSDSRPRKNTLLTQSQLKSGCATSHLTSPNQIHLAWQICKKISQQTCRCNPFVSQTAGAILLCMTQICTPKLIMALNVRSAKIERSLASQSAVNAQIWLSKRQSWICASSLRQSKRINLSSSCLKYRRTLQHKNWMIKTSWKSKSG